MPAEEFCENQGKCRSERVFRRSIFRNSTSAAGTRRDVSCRPKEELLLEAINLANTRSGMTGEFPSDRFSRGWERGREISRADTQVAAEERGKSRGSRPFFRKVRDSRRPVGSRNSADFSGGGEDGEWGAGGAGRDTR